MRSRTKQPRSTMFPDGAPLLENLGSRSAERRSTGAPGTCCSKSLDWNVQFFWYWTLKSVLDSASTKTNGLYGTGEKPYQRHVASQYYKLKVAGSWTRKTFLQCFSPVKTKTLLRAQSKTLMQTWGMWKRTLKRFHRRVHGWGGRYMGARVVFFPIEIGIHSQALSEATFEDR